MSGGREQAGGWRKSSQSASGSCVEVRFSGDHVHVRNSRDRSGAVLAFTTDEWDAFLAGARQGEFDIPTGPPRATHA
jgi:hypothetical protein